MHLPASNVVAAPLTIAQAARAAGVPASTVRFYEREGIIGPSGRSGGNYRLYDQEAIGRLRFVRAAQDIGLPLKDIKAVIDMDERTNGPEVLALLEARLSDVKLKLKELLQVRKALSAALVRCRRSCDQNGRAGAGGGACCNVLVSLNIESGRSKGRPPSQARTRGGPRRAQKP
jgi:MerR family transcriptional regulator, mercuric resistance operon regulatory protein